MLRASALNTLRTCIPKRNELKASSSFRSTSSKTKTSKDKDANFKTHPKIVGLTNYLYALHRTTDPTTPEQFQVHETIEQAWQLHSQLQQEQANQQLKKKFIRMREAMLQLEQHHPEHFKWAMEKEGEEIFVHRMLKAPTNTPAKTVWPE